MSSDTTILIRAEHWQAAHGFMHIHGDRLSSLDNVIKSPPGTVTRIATGLPCPTCGALANHPCFTKSAQAAKRPHKDRYTYAFAAMFAVRDEPVIVEEEDIEDVLDA
jgi:hypothetical protein